jgi:hypothetical protein
MYVYIHHIHVYIAYATFAIIRPGLFFNAKASLLSGRPRKEVK